MKRAETPWPADAFAMDSIYPHGQTREKDYSSNFDSSYVYVSQPHHFNTNRLNQPHTDWLYILYPHATR